MWCAKVRKNGYQLVVPRQDFSSNAQNVTNFGELERLEVKKRLRDGGKTCADILTVYSHKKKKRVTIGRSTVSRIAKETGLVVAVPKALRVGGTTAHHNRMRRSDYWLDKGQAFVNGVFFCDESKIRFKDKRNKRIDIKWVTKGTAGESNWYDDPVHCAQINIIMLQSRNGIEWYKIYKKHMKKEHYVK